MKQLSAIIFLSLLTAVFSPTVQATIRRVGFVQAMTPVNGMDYATFQSAHDAAAAGDTIQLYPSAKDNYGAGYTGTITKKLIILGPGYWYNSYNLPYGVGLFNPNLQGLPGNVYNNNFTVAKGSSGTVFQGLYYTTLYTANITDSINDITITRCRYFNANITNSGVCNNWRLTKCFQTGITQYGFDAAFTGNRSITNLRIENCFGPAIYYAATGPQSPQGANTGQVVNCIFTSNSSNGLESMYNGSMSLNNGYFLFQNNIDAMSYFINNISNTTNCIFVNNMTNINSLNSPVFTNPGSTGNIFNVNFAGNSIFTSVPNNVSGSTYLNSPDAAYKLSVSSPAKNAGLIPGTSTPTDLGAFGGLDPYILSGIPPVPSFYRLNSGSATASTSPYTMTFSVRGNN